jgi:hypothetical protein
MLGHMSHVTTQRYAHLAELPSVDVLAALGRPRCTVAGRTRDQLTSTW